MRTRMVGSQRNYYRLVTGLLCFSLVLVIALWLEIPPAAAQGPVAMTGVTVSATQSAVVDIAALARQEALRSPASVPAQGKAIPFETFVEPGDLQTPRNAPALSAAPSQPAVSTAGPTLSYIGLDDISAGGYYFIPPDTMGAVGLTRTLDTLNNNYRVQNKSNGATIGTVSIGSFWASTGATGTFDPKTFYDPYNDRFIVVAASNSFSTTSSIEVGVSTGSDPNGSYYLFRIQICGAASCGGGLNWWADYPTVGFNKNWVVIATNMYSNTAPYGFNESRVLVVDYPQLRANTFAATLFFGATSDFSIQPCVTYSNVENTLYAPEHWGSTSATYRLHTITGTAGSPTFNPGAIQTHTLAPLSGGWTMPSGNILPQANGSAGITDTAKIDVGDARILKCTFRNGGIWYSQNVYLPKGAPTHTAAQWVKLDTGGNDLDGGRVEDPTATATNGGKWYAYPTLTVNRFNEVLMGFTQFASNQWPSAGYTFRASADAAGTMRDPYIYKAGEGFYWKTFHSPCASGSNRWGDYSATQVDPVDDTAMWTLQEYSKPEGSPFAATGCNSGVWSTWWAQVTPQHLFLPLILR